VSLAAKFKSNGNKQMEEIDGNKYFESGKYRSIKCFYYSKLDHIRRVCKKLLDEKHNQENSCDDQFEKKYANVAEHKEEEFHVFMAMNKDSKSDKDDWYMDSRESRNFTNIIDWYTDFVQDAFQSDSVVLSGRE
jgi:hypothetical protein